jgi:hypothetical protein
MFFEKKIIVKNIYLKKKEIFSIGHSRDKAKSTLKSPQKLPLG